MGLVSFFFFLQTEQLAKMPTPLSTVSFWSFNNSSLEVRLEQSCSRVKPLSQFPSEEHRVGSVVLLCVHMLKEITSK